MAAIVRIYNGPDGLSRFEDIEPPFGEPAYPGWPIVSAPAEGTLEITFHRAEAGASLGWHAAPLRQYVIIQFGSLSIEVWDGTRRDFGPGATFLAEDLEGRGHLSEFTGTKPCNFALVPLSTSMA